MKSIYRLTHTYDKGNQDVYIKCDVDPCDFAVWVQFLCEENIDISFSLWTEGVAKVLIEYFGCEQVTPVDNAIILDMYYERSKRCGIGFFEKYNAIYSSYNKQAIIDFIEPMSDYDRENPEPELLFQNKPVS